MPTRILYAVVRNTGQRFKLLTLHPDGSLTPESSDMVKVVPKMRDRDGCSNEFIFWYMKRKSNAYVEHVEEVVDE